MSLETFQASVLASCRGLWNGNLDNLGFADAMFSAIRRGYEQAWAEGAKECGIKADERTPEETAQLGRMIGDNFQYVANFGQWIFEHNQASGTKFETIKGRAKVWVNRYNEVKSQAQVMACANQKLRWQIDGGEHCRSCLKLNGRVARASAWNERDCYPRMTNQKLKCGGFSCKCSLVPTDDKATRGRWPNLP